MFICIAVAIIGVLQLQRDIETLNHAPTDTHLPVPEKTSGPDSDPALQPGYAENMYIEILQAEIDPLIVQDYKRDTLIAWGQQVCSSMANHTESDYVQLVLDHEGETQNILRFLMHPATAALCPEYTDQIDAFYASVQMRTNP